MNPSRASERSELRQALGSDEAVASYVSQMKGRQLHIHHYQYPDRAPAQDARRLIDIATQGSLTDLLYKSREDSPK